MAVFLPFFGYGQIINESIVRASIASNIPTNANKQITAAMLRPVLGQIVSFVKSGANGVTADSLAAENYIPFFKTTGSIANSPFRVGSGTVGLGTVANSAATLSIIAHSDGSTPNPYAHNLRLGAKEYLGVKSSGIDFDGGGGDAKNGSIVNLDGSMSISAAKEVASFGVDSVSLSGGKGVFIRSTSGQIRFSTGAGVGSPRMNITGAGNVGIGTLLPLTKHHVAGANDEWLHTVSSTDGSLFNNGSIRIAGLNTAFGAPTIQARSADGSIYRALVLDAAAMNIKIQGNERFTVDQFGNVGIRTSSPFFALDVNGIVNTRTDTYLATLGGKVGVRRSSPTYMFDVGGSLRTDSASYFATVDGNVGIGTTSANTKFDVRGSTAIKGVHTTQDYRFLNFTVSGERIGLLVQNDTYNNSTSSFESHNGIVSSPEVNATSTGGTLVYGLNTSPQVSSTVAGTSINATGGFYSAGRANAADVGTNASLNGIVANATHNSSAGSGIVTTNAYGVVGRTNPQTGTMTNSFGVWSHTNLAHFGNQTATIGTHYGLYTSGTIGQAGGTGVATMTTYYDAYLAGAIVNSSGTLTNRWGLYQANSAHKNYFAGNVGIGTTSPSAPLHVNGAVVFTPMAAASVPTAVEGMIVCVNTTNGTFTSTGFWGYYGGTWTKMSN